MPEREPVAWKEVPRVEGVQAKRTLRPFNGSLGIAAPSKNGTTDTVSERGRRTKCERLLEGLRRTRAVVLIHTYDKSGERQRRAVVLAVRDCGVSVMNCGPQILLTKPATEIKGMVAHR